MRPGSFLSTDPDGRIEQPFASDESGGFLRVRVEPTEAGATLRASFHDELGVVLHRMERSLRSKE